MTSGRKAMFRMPGRTPLSKIASSTKMTSPTLMSLMAKRPRPPVFEVALFRPFWCKDGCESQEGRAEEEDEDEDDEDEDEEEVVEAVEEDEGAAEDEYEEEEGGGDEVDADEDEGPVLHEVVSAAVPKPRRRTSDCGDPRPCIARALIAVVVATKGAVAALTAAVVVTANVLLQMFVDIAGQDA
mmetsp:Transcript_37248/g.81003  ORF Transcript_37248/g.81003 Transcript_37248/m.81003 type:complete len:184 (-) Transcript_37248:47-598(-)